LDIKNEEEYFQKYQNKIRNLSKYLEGHEIEILVYLRPQVEWFASAINQTIRIEGLMSEQRVYEDDLQFLQLMKPLLNYQKILQTWQTELTPSKFQIVPYVRKNLHNKSSISDFLKQTNLSHVSLPFKQEKMTINASISREYIEYKKVLNRRSRSKLEERIIIKCLEELSKTSKFSDKYKLDDTTVKLIEDYSYPQNEMINKEFNLNENPMNSLGSYGDSELSAITVEDLEIAKKNFDKKITSLPFRILKTEFFITSFLRNNIPLLHGALHQVRRLLRLVQSNKYRKS